VNEIFLNVVNKTMEKFVLPSLVSCVTHITSFDFKKSQVRFDIFAMVVSFDQHYKHGNIKIITFITTSLVIMNSITITPCPMFIIFHPTITKVNVSTNH